MRNRLSDQDCKDIRAQLHQWFGGSTKNRKLIFSTKNCSSIMSIHSEMCLGGENLNLIMEDDQHPVEVTSYDRISEAGMEHSDTSSVNHSDLASISAEIIEVNQRVHETSVESDCIDKNELKLHTVGNESSSVDSETENEEELCQDNTTAMTMDPSTTAAIHNDSPFSEASTLERTQEINNFLAESISQAKSRRLSIASPVRIEEIQNSELARKILGRSRGSRSSSFQRKIIRVEELSSTYLTEKLGTLKRARYGEMFGKIEIPDKPHSAPVSAANSPRESPDKRANAGPLNKLQFQQSKSLSSQDMLKMKMQLGRQYRSQSLTPLQTTPLSESSSSSTSTSPRSSSISSLHPGKSSTRFTVRIHTESTGRLSGKNKVTARIRSNSIIISSRRGLIRRVLHTADLNKVSFIDREHCQLGLIHQDETHPSLILSFESEEIKASFVQAITLAKSSI